MRTQTATVDTNDLLPLPPGWRYESVGALGQPDEQAVLTGPFGTNLGRSDFVERGVPVLTIGCLTEGGIAVDKALYVSEQKAQELERYRLREGDLLFSRMASVGRAGIVPKSLAGALFNYHIMRLRLDVSRIDPRVFINYVRGAQQVRVYLKAVNHGATRDGINTEQLLGLPVAVPPAAMQREIVAEIEKQFSRLDEAVANLKRVKANFKRYKAAVLKAAVEGRLVPTEAELARREGRSYETGTQLLQSLGTARWNKAEGKRNYEQSITGDSMALPELPEGWAWARLDAVACIKGGITVDKKRQDPTARPVPYLRVANVQRGYLDLREMKTLDASQADIEELRLQPGDILFNEGGDRDKLGRGWIWEGQLSECIHQNHVFRARLRDSKLSAKLISWWGNTFGQRYFLREGKQTTNLASINLTKLAALPVPIPPYVEQQRLRQEIERRFTLIEDTESELDSNILRADYLRQSVLGRAFAARGS